MSSAASDLRLMPCERDGIRSAIARACAEAGAHSRRIVLFGSRTNLRGRGGDIDLLIELDPRHPVDTFRLTQRLRLALEDELGEQRVDLVLDDGRGDGVFPDIARHRGVELWPNT